MANASLQIGNGNWAIKENDLLGYSKSGTRFLPIPITMTRATLGTRVNPSGLVEDVALLGSELVVNGAWTDVDGAATFYDNKIKINSGVNGTLNRISQTILENNKSYRVQYEVLEDTGVTNLSYFNGQTYVSIPKTIGVHTFYYAKLQTSLNFYLRVGDSVSGNYIVIKDNISVKEATIDGLARVDYTDGTGSLLVEPQRTNLLTYSEDFTQSVWVKESGGTGDNPIVTSNIGISPDGTQNADKIVFDLNGGTSSSDLSQLRFSLSSLSGDYTNSIYLKSFDGASYNVSILDANGIVYAATITNEWQRFEYYNGGGTTSINPFRIRLRGNESTSDNAALLIYGAQLENGSYPTSYIKTQGSTVTRNQDEYTKTGISDKINSEEGVLFTDIAALSDDGTNRIITLSDGSYNNSIRIAYYTNTNEIEIRLVVGGVIQVLSRVNISNVLIFNKIAFKYKVNDFALWVNGTEIYSLSSGSTYASETLNRLAFDDGSSSNNFFGKVKQLQVFKTALSDSELATLTTI